MSSNRSSRGGLYSEVTSIDSELITTQKVNRVWLEFFSEMCFLAIVHNLIQYKIIDFKSEDKCGIPIVYWLNVFVLAVVLKSFGGLAKIWVLWTAP